MILVITLKMTSVINLRDYVLLSFIRTSVWVCCLMKSLISRRLYSWYCVEYFSALKSFRFWSYCTWAIQYQWFCVFVFPVRHLCYLLHMQFCKTVKRFWKKSLMLTKAAFIWFQNTVNTLKLWCYNDSRFAAEETFLLIINIESCCLLNFLWNLWCILFSIE